MRDPGEVFADLLDRAKSHPGVLGLALTGSRATDLYDDASDYDGALFVEESTAEEAQSWLIPETPGVDIRVFTPASFATHARWGSSTAWDRYAWFIARFVVDRTDGELVDSAREKGRVPEQEVSAYVDASLDWYLNQVRRALRCHETGDPIGARLEGAEAVRPFLQASFAVHDRRVVPYYRFLAWELRERPLGRFSSTSSEILGAVADLVIDGSRVALARVLGMALEVFPPLGYVQRFEEWEVDTWWERFFDGASA